jgi:hypothetical protein
VTSWRRRLGEVIADPKPTDYRYHELANLLSHLGFEEGGRGTSHRVWRFVDPRGNVHRVVLVDKGHGPVKRVYVEKMCTTIKAAGLAP